MCAKWLGFCLRVHEASFQPVSPRVTVARERMQKVPRVTHGPAGISRQPVFLYFGYGGRFGKYAGFTFDNPQKIMVDGSGGALLHRQWVSAHSPQRGRYPPTKHRTLDDVHRSFAPCDSSRLASSNSRAPFLSASRSAPTCSSQIADRPAPRRNSWCSRRGPSGSQSTDSRCGESIRFCCFRSRRSSR